MGKPSNRQTTIIQPDAPSLLEYSQSLTPQRNFNGLFNYTPLSFQEQADLLQKDLETRQNERQAARATYLSAPSDATNQETPSNVRTRQAQTNQRQIDNQQQNKDNQRLLTAYWQRTGDYRTAPEVAIQNQRLYEQTPQLNDYNLVHPLGDPMEYDTNTRLALGRFTQDDRQRAADLYTARTTNLTLGRAPDFGIEYASQYPYGELGAFRNVAKVGPISILGGLAAIIGPPVIGNGSKLVLKALQPSTWANVIAGQVPQYASTIRTAGLLGDAGMYSYFAANSINNLASDNGINKTIDLYGNGDIWGGTKSLAGDALDVFTILPTVQTAYKYGRGLLDPRARQTAFIRQIFPIGYEGHTKEIGKFGRDWMLYPTYKLPPVPQYSMEDIDPLMKMNIRTRQDAIRLSLGFPLSPNSSYTLNPDGTYSYNYINIFKKLVPENEQDFVRSVAALNINNLFKQAHQSGVIYKPGASGVIRDPITGAGGNVKVTVTQNGGFVIDDVWDLEPFKHKRWLPKPIRDFEAIKFLGGEPLVLKHEIPQGFYLHSEVLGK